MSDICVGIPRALYYYKFYPLWKTFFDQLGIRTVLSSPTCRKTLDTGICNCIEEACLPVKVFHGHVAEIADKADMLFVPRLTSISKKEYICPKIGGLPDMLKCSFHGKMPPIIDVEINLRNGKKHAIKSAIDVAKLLGKSRQEAKKAFEVSKQEYYMFRKKIKSRELPKGWIKADINKNSSSKNKPVILLLGHPYNIYDSYINMNLPGKLENMGAKVITVDMFDGDFLTTKSSVLDKKMFWNYGTLALGCIYNALESKQIEGIIYVMSFGCGVDSFVCSMAERRVRNHSNKPFSIITLDEHSGEAGLNTRIEAFMDMLTWRNAI